jgi:HEAT repeat protein
MTAERRLDDLIHVLHDPDDIDAYERAFDLVGAEPLDIDEDLLPPERDLPYMRRELVCNELAEIGREAQEAVPALIHCAEDETDNSTAKFMQFAAVSAIWKVTGDPALSVQICERFLHDREFWFRRWLCELLEEIAHPAALPALRERLADDHPEVREAAERAIERIS